jgi:cell division protein ZapB
MDNDDLKQLENRIDQLLGACDRLKQENHDLKNNQGSLAKEHADLTEKTKQARARIQSMIERLKTLERS